MFLGSIVSGSRDNARSDVSGPKQDKTKATHLTSKARKQYPIQRERKVA